MSNDIKIGAFPFEDNFGADQLILITAGLVEMYGFEVVLVASDPTNPSVCVDDFQKLLNGLICSVWGAELDPDWMLYEYDCQGSVVFDKLFGHVLWEGFDLATIVGHTPEVIPTYYHITTEDEDHPLIQPTLFLDEYYDDDERPKFLN